MTNLFQIGAIDSCGGLLPIVRVIRKGVFPLVQLFIPIVLIVLGTIDLGKAVIASDDKESYSGENWEVITEDEYNKRKNSEENSPFASLKDLDLDD